MFLFCIFAYHRNVKAIVNIAHSGRLEGRWCWGDCEGMGTGGGVLQLVAAINEILSDYARITNYSSKVIISMLYRSHKYMIVHCMSRVKPCRQYACHFSLFHFSATCVRLRTKEIGYLLYCSLQQLTSIAETLCP